MGLFFEMLQRLLFFVGYIGGGNSFPKPLSKDDEKKYTEMLARGDEGAKNILIEHNLRLVAHIAKKYGNDSNFDDLVSVGTIGLIKGINTFDAQKNPRLSSYIARCIENEILMCLRSAKRIAAEISLDESIGCDSEGNSMTISDTLAAPDCDVLEEVAGRLEEKKLYDAVMTELTPTERKLIGWRYGLGGGKRKTQQEVSELLGISRSYVSRIEKKAVRKLAAGFGEK